MSMDTIEVEVDTTAPGYGEELVFFKEVDNEAHDRFTHIVNPPNNVHIWQEGMSAQDVVDIARTNGWPVRALCGKEWIPKHNPDKYPACPTCMGIAHQIMSEMG